MAAATLQHVAGRLRAGLTSAQINLGSADIELDEDGWTVRTRDGSLSAQFEHSVLATHDGVEILTVPPPEG